MMPMSTAEAGAAVPTPRTVPARIAIHTLMLIRLLSSAVGAIEPASNHCSIHGVKDGMRFGPCGLYWSGIGPFWPRVIDVIAQRGGENACRSAHDSLNH